MKPPDGAPLAETAIEFSVSTNTVYERFCRTRQVMLLAWRDWLSTAPAASDIEAELTGTCSAMEQFRALHAGRRR